MATTKRLHHLAATTATCESEESQKPAGVPTAVQTKAEAVATASTAHSAIADDKEDDKEDETHFSSKTMLAEDVRNVWTLHGSMSYESEKNQTYTATTAAFESEDRSAAVNGFSSHALMGEELPNVLTSSVTALAVECFLSLGDGLTKPGCEGALCGYAASDRPGPPPVAADATDAADAAATSTKGATFRGFDKLGATRHWFAEPGSTHDVMVYHAHFVPAGWNKHIDTVAPVTRMLGQPSRSLTSSKLFARVATALRAAAASVCAARSGWAALGDKQIRRGSPAAVLLVLMIVLMLSAPAEAVALGVNTSVSSSFANTTALSGFRRTQEEGAGFAGPGCELAEQYARRSRDRYIVWGHYMRQQSQECQDYWSGLCAEVVVIREGVTEIPARAFDGCASLTTVDIPDSVHTIGSGAFAYCYSLTVVAIPDSVETVTRDVWSPTSSLPSFRDQTVLCVRTDAEVPTNLPWVPSCEMACDEGTTLPISSDLDWDNRAIAPECNICPFAERCPGGVGEDAMCVTGSITGVSPGTSRGFDH
eukprot:COSAG06_NODE_3432_length_5355_cov_9.890982_1_plen_536_part_10